MLLFSLHDLLVTHMSTVLYLYLIFTLVILYCCYENNYLIDNTMFHSYIEQGLFPKCIVKHFSVLCLGLLQSVTIRII